MSTFYGQVRGTTTVLRAKLSWMGSAFVVVLALIAIGYRLALFMSPERVERRREGPPPDPSDPRWYASAGEQVTGRTCADCTLKIAVQNDGRFCRKCHAALHRKTCSRRHRALAHPLGGPAPYR